jgi:anti-anti-sigma regulatory factor
MVSQVGAGDVRTSVKMDLQLSRGRHGAAARLEVHERPAGRVGLLALRGWVDAPAALGIERALGDLSARGVSRLIVDCSQLLHVDYRLVPRLADSLLQFEAQTGAVVLCGLSRYLRDLFRIAGCESKLCCWPSAADLLDAVAPARDAVAIPNVIAGATERERAS